MLVLRYILGESEVSFDSCYFERAFSVLSGEDIPFRKLQKAERVSLLVPLYRSASVKRLLFSVGIEAKIGRATGLPGIIIRYRKRLGIPLGCLAFFLIVWMSGRVIWCVNIEGNSKVSDDQIIELLSRLGCGVGDTYEDIDFDTLHNRFLIESEGIGWIAVNMNGTHANVEVREILPEEKSEKTGFYNIVAKEAGQIERLADTEGKPVVEIGDTVLEGELLISGAISYKQDTLNRFESADGAVFAKVNRSFTVTVPVKQSVKEYTGEEISKNTLRFFNFDINLFRNSSIQWEFCDKMAVYKQIYLFDSIALPVYVNKNIYREYRMKEVTLSKKEAEELCKKEYTQKLAKVLSDGEILSKSVSESFDGENYTVSCNLYCLADIGEKVPLIITEESQNTKETEK